MTKQFFSVAAKLFVCCLTLLTLLPRASAQETGPGCGIAAGSLNDRLRLAMTSQDAKAIGRVIADLRQKDNSTSSKLEGRFRRPFSRDYRRQLTNKQLENLAQYLVRFFRNQPWMRRSGQARSVRTPERLYSVAAGIESMVFLSEAFPDVRADALAVAERAADGLITLSNSVAFGGIPLPLTARSQQQAGIPALGLAASGADSSCALQPEAERNGWAVLESRPDLYFQATARIGSAFVGLTRATKKQRFRAWATKASDWIHSQPYAAEFIRNSYVADLEAQLYLYTSERRHIERAVQRVVFGVLPGFGNGGSRAGRWLTPDSDTFDARLSMTRTLVNTAIAIEAAPSGIVETAQKNAIQRSAQVGYRELEQALIRGRGVVSPGIFTQLYLDIQAARRAGVEFVEPDKDLQEMMLATVVRKLSKNVIMAGASNARLLMALKDRAFGSRHRPSP